MKAPAQGARVVDADGGVVRRDVVASDPDVLAKWLGRHCHLPRRLHLSLGPVDRLQSRATPGSRNGRPSNMSSTHDFSLA